MRHASTIIVGGGITGSALLHKLASRGEDVLLLEAADRLGGVIRSHRTSFGTLEESGPNSTMSTCELQELIDELGLDEEVVSSQPAARKRYIVVRGSLLPTPSGPGDFVRTKLFSTAGKLRMLREPFVRARRATGDESVADFVTRRLGREALDYAVDPFVSGVYAGSAQQLSMRSAFPMLHRLEVEHGSLLRGMIARMRSRRSASATRLRRRGMLSFADGMETLPRRIQERWSEHVVIDTAVTSVYRAQDDWVVDCDGARYSCHNLVLAVPAAAAARLVAHVPLADAGALQAIPYVPVVSVASVYRRQDVQHALDGFGCLAPSIEARRVLGVIFASSIFSDRTPAGTVLVRTLVGGARMPELAETPDADLIELVQAEHQQLIGAVARPITTTIERMPEAIPQYNVGHDDIVAAIVDTEMHNDGLYFAGSYRGGVSVGDCVRSAFQLADRIEMQRAAMNAHAIEEVEAAL